MYFQFTFCTQGDWQLQARKFHIIWQLFVELAMYLVTLLSSSSITFPFVDVTLSLMTIQPPFTRPRRHLRRNEMKSSTRYIVISQYKWMGGNRLFSWIFFYNISLKLSWNLNSFPFLVNQSNFSKLKVLNRFVQNLKNYFIVNPT